MTDADRLAVIAAAKADQCWAIAEATFADIVRIADEGPRPGNVSDAILVTMMLNLVAGEICTRRAVRHREDAT